MKNPLSSTRRKASNNPNIKKIETNYTENTKQNSFFSVYPNTTKSHKHINLNYQNKYLKKEKKTHNGLTKISYGQPYSLFVSHHTQRDSSESMSNTKFKLQNIKDKEVKINDQGDSSIVLSDQNSKEIIRIKDQEIEQLRSELTKAKELLVDSKTKLALYNLGREQFSAELECHRDKGNKNFDTNVLQEHDQRPNSQVVTPTAQASIDHLIIDSEKLIKEENKMRNMSSINCKGSYMTLNLAEMKTALCELKKRTQRLLEHK